MNSVTYDALQWVSRLIYRCGVAFVTCSMAIIVFLVAGQVVFRYVFNGSIVWANEAVTLILVWMVYVGAALAIHDDEMVAIVIFVQRLGSKGRIAIRLIVDAVLVSFVSVMIYINQSVLELSSSTPMPVMRIAKSWSHLSLSIGFLICVLFLAKNIVDTLRSAPPASGGGS